MRRGLNSNVRGSMRVAGMSSSILHLETKSVRQSLRACSKKLKTSGTTSPRARVREDRKKQSRPSNKN